MKANLAQAALGILANDPAFQARFPSEQSPTDSGQSPEAPAPATPAAEPESGGPPAKLAGKYDDVTQLEKGYENAQSHITTLSGENRALREALDVLKASGPKPSPEPEPDPVLDLEQYGVPAEVARAAMTKVAADAVKQFMGPMLALAQAEAEFTRSNAEYQNHAPKVEAFLKENSNVSAVAEALFNAGKIREAKQYVWDQYRVANVSVFEAEKVERNEKLRLEREKAKLDAGVGSTQKGQTRATQTDPREARMVANRQAMARGGDRMALGRYTADLIGLPDNFGQQ